MSASDGMSAGEWRAASYGLNPGDSLIDLSKIPVITLYLGDMQAAASKIKAAGVRVHAAGAAINHQWQGLRHSYRAPETSQLCNGSTLVVRKADDVQTRLARIGDAVWHFAAALQGLISELNGLRKQAEDFVDWAMRVAPGDWPHMGVPPWAGGDGGVLLGRGRNDQLAEAICAVLTKIEALEAEYAGQIECAFDSTFEPAPAPPQPFHSRIEAEDAAAAAATDWRGFNLDGIGLPWGGEAHGPGFADRVLTGVGESLESLVLTVPAFVGLAPDSTGHVHFTLKTLKNAWEGLGNMMMAVNPTTWVVPSQARRNWQTLTKAVKGFVGIDAQGNWGAEGLGRGIGNVGLLFVPGLDEVGLVPVSAAAERGAALIEAGGLKNIAGGVAMSAPKWVTSGGWAAMDVRTLRAALDDTSLLNRLVDASGNGWRLPPLPEHPPLAAAERAVPHVDGVGSEPPRDFEAGVSGAGTAHSAALDDALSVTNHRLAEAQDNAVQQRQQILDKAAADSVGKSLTERTQIQRDVNAQIRQLSERTSRITQAISREGEHRNASISNRFYDELDDLRTNADMPPTPDHSPITLPDAQRSILDRFLATGMDEQTAVARSQELIGLRHTPLAGWEDEQNRLLKTYLGAGPQITEHTPLSKVVDAATVRATFAENRATVRGFVTQDAFVRDAVRPVDRVDALALNYHLEPPWSKQETLLQKASWLAHRGKVYPYGLPVPGYGELVYRTHPDDVDAYRVPLGGDSSAAQDAARQFPGDHVSVHDAPAPFTGMGLTGGGVPEYTVREVRMADGAKMYWYKPTADGGVTRLTLGTFRDGHWHASTSVPPEYLDVGVAGEPATGRGPWSAAAHRGWARLPEGLADKLEELGRGELASELSTQDPNSSHNHPPGYQPVDPARLPDPEASHR